MRIRVVLALCLLFLLPLSAITVDARAAGVALVYSGRGTCEGCAEAVAAMAAKAGLQVSYINDPQKIPDLLESASLLVIGGTVDDTEPMRRGFEPVADDIREYIHEGGRYLGICGGAFFASQGWPMKKGMAQGFGLIPAATDYYIDDQTPMVVPVDWRGRRVGMYYQAGPWFDLEPDEEPVEILMRYEDGSPAGLLCGYGRGKVLVFGPHPEAPKSWLTDDDVPLDGWDPTDALGAKAIRDLLSDRPAGGR